MRYLTVDEIIRINEIEVGPNLLRDASLLEAVAQRPQASAFGDAAYPDIHAKAAALMHSLRGMAAVSGRDRATAAKRRRPRSTSSG